MREKTVRVCFFNQMREELVGKLIGARLAHITHKGNIALAVAGCEIFGIEANGNVVTGAALDEANVMHLH